MSKEIQQLDWIESWLAGKLEGAALTAFEQKRIADPDFAAQCLLAAALNEQGRQQRKQQFLKGLARIESELAAEGFFEAEKPEEVPSTSVKLPNKEEFKAQLSRLEAKLREEGTLEPETTETMRPIPVWKTWRRQLLAAAAALFALIVAVPFFTHGDSARLYAVAQAHLANAPFPAPSYQSKGLTPMPSAVVDSLLHFGKYAEAEKLLDTPSTTEKYQQFWLAVSLLHNSKLPGDDKAKRAVKILKDLAMADEFESNSAWMVKSQLALAYLKTGERGAAEETLTELRISGNTEYAAFANEVLSKIQITK